jgi:nicotinamidase-related amidase
VTGDWRTFLPESERAVYGRAGYGMRQEWGVAPAVLVIDVTIGFAGRPDLDEAENRRLYSTYCAPEPESLDAILELVAAARDGGRPVFFTTVPEAAADHIGRWRVKHPKTLEAPSDSRELLPALGQRGGELLVEKGKPSAFFATPLLPLLIERGVDSLIVTGCTTSGCVRATVVDAFSYGFATFVPEEAVFDRVPTSHLTSLFELNQKYADVVSTADVVDVLTATSRRSV